MFHILAGTCATLPLVASDSCDILKYPATIKSTLGPQKRVLLTEWLFDMLLSEYLTALLQRRPNVRNPGDLLLHCSFLPFIMCSCYPHSVCLEFFFLCSSMRTDGCRSGSGRYGRALLFSHSIDKVSWGPVASPSPSSWSLPGDHSNHMVSALWPELSFVLRCL